jgi:cystathionine beta-lyase family protein involved in aluminum resistance
MVGEAMKGNYLLAATFDALGYPVNPAPSAPQRDVIQAIRLGSLRADCLSARRFSSIHPSMPT